MRLHDLNNEVLTSIAGHLVPKDLFTFSTVCRKFLLIAHSDMIWKEMLYNRFGVTYKLPLENWKDMYARKADDPQHSKMCPHIAQVTSHVLEPYAVKYQQVLNWLPQNLNCSTCRTNCKDAGLCLYVWKGNVRNRCKDCAYTYHKSVEGHGILIRMNVLQMFCFDCKRLLGETRGDLSEAHHVDFLLKALTHDSDKGKEALERKRQCIRERVRYSDEADRKSVLDAGQYYFVERLWLVTWFLRLCDGKIGEGPIANNELEDPERPGMLNPGSRPRGNFTGGFSIVTPSLWEYLVKTYKLAGNVYTSDDISGSEYDQLKQSIVDWRLN